MAVTKKHLRYFKKAELVAQLSDYSRTHIGCVAVYRNQIIGCGFNTNKTHPRQKYYNRYRVPDGEVTYISTLPKLHAEIDCINQIRHLDIDFSKVDLYIFRTCKDRDFGIARPCPACMSAIMDLGIRNIHYTTNYGFADEYLEVQVG